MTAWSISWRALVILIKKSSVDRLRQQGGRKIFDGDRLKIDQEQEEEVEETAYRQKRWSSAVVFVSFVCNSWSARPTSSISLLAVGNRSVDCGICFSIRRKKRALALVREFVSQRTMKLSSDWYLQTPFPARCHAHLSFDFKQKQQEPLHSYVPLSTDRQLQHRTRNRSLQILQECTRERIYWSNVISIFWIIIPSMGSTSSRSSRTTVSIWHSSFVQRKVPFGTDASSVCSAHSAIPSMFNHPYFSSIPFIFRIIPMSIPSLAVSVYRAVKSGIHALHCVYCWTN